MLKWIGVGFGLTLGYLFANLLFKMALWGWLLILTPPIKVPGIGA